MQRPPLSNSQKYIKYSLISLSIILAIAIVLLGLKTYKNQQDEIQEQKKSLQQKAKTESRSLAKNFETPHLAVEEIKTKIENNDFTNEQIIALLKKELNKYPELFGVGIAYEKDVNGKLYAPYVNHFKDGSFQLTDVAEEYDYTDEALLDDKSISNDWYIDTVKHGEMWSEPYYDQINHTHVIEYDLPFYDKSGKFLGIIYANYSLETAREMLFDIDLGKTGFGLVVTPAHNILIHPNQKIMGLPFEEVIDGDNSHKLINIIDNKTLTDKGRFSETYDSKNHQVIWVAMQNIPNTPWVLIVVDNAEENLYLSLQSLEIHLKIILYLSIIFLIALSALIFKVYRNLYWRYFAFSSSICFIFILGALAYPWTIVETNEDRGITPIYNQSTLTHYLENNDYLENPNHHYTLIPMGIFIQNMFFTAPSSIRVSAYIWHKYPKDAVDVNPGFILPQQTNEKFERLEFEVEEADYKLYTWHVILELEFIPKTSLFPFGSQTLSIDLWALDFHKYLFGTPDFVSYDTSLPKQLMGIDDDIFLKSWDLTQSYFSYKDSNMATNFGNIKYQYRNGIPQLAFNVTFKRKLLGPLVIYFLPLFLVICCAYLSVMRWALFKSESPYTILGFAATLLFVLSVSHVALRDVLNASLISYAEYCYLLGYLITVLAAFNNLLYLNKVKVWFIMYRNNLLPKLIFWPFVGLYILVITIVLFTINSN